MAQGPAAMASLGKLLEMLKLRLHSRPSEPEAAFQQDSSQLRALRSSLVTHRLVYVTPWVEPSSKGIVETRQAQSCEMFQ